MTKHKDQDQPFVMT